MSVGKLDRLKQELVFHRDLSYLTSIEIDEQNGNLKNEDVIITSVGKWRVFVSPSFRVSPLVVDFGRDGRLYLDIRTEDHKIFVSTRGDRTWNENDVKAFLDNQLISDIIMNVKADTNHGDAHKVKGKKLTVWNFHNYQVYHKA